MKKILNLIMFLLIAFFVVSCSSMSGPSFCDCNDNYGSLSSSDQDKCAKMIDKMSEAEIIRKMQKCKNK